MRKSYELKFDDTPDSLELIRDKWRAKQHRKYRLPSLTSIILNTTLLYSYARRNETKLFLDIHFIPNVTKFSFMNWGAYEELVKAGYEHAMEVLSSDELK
jgi:NTE family protein